MLPHQHMTEKEHIIVCLSVINRYHCAAFNKININLHFLQIWYSITLFIKVNELKYNLRDQTSYISVGQVKKGFLYQTEYKNMKMTVNCGKPLRAVINMKYAEP